MTRAAIDEVKLLGHLPLAVALVIAFGACASVPETSQSSGVGTYRRLSLSPGPYFGIAWINERLLAVGRSPLSREEGNATVVSIATDDSSVQPLVRAQDPTCQVTDYLHPTRLPDGRLGVTESCIRTMSRTDVSLIAYSTRDATTERLTRSPITPARVSWSPGLEVAVISNSDELCSGIARLKDGSVEYFDTVVADDGMQFNLRDAYTSVGIDGCKSTGLADWPSWSPDGDLIAFFASPSSVGVEGARKPQSDWNLYTMDAKGLHLRLLLRGLQKPRALAWSTEGTQLAFSGLLPPWRGHTDCCAGI